MAWQARSAPFATEAGIAHLDAPPLHKVQITVFWGDAPPRKLTLRTLRPQRLPQPGEGLMQR